MVESIKIFSPATVANVACGFDVLGFCLDHLGDEMVIKKTKNKGIRITKCEGFDLSMNIEQNVAGVSAMAMYKDLNPDCGFDIEIYKNIKPGSGIGSSAASAVGSVFGMNELLGRPCDKTELTFYAMKGEALASQCEHADNLAPAIFGGFTLVKSICPLEVLEIPTPENLYATIIHPHVEIKTSEARAILPNKVDLQNAIKQWANLGSLIHALHTNDYELIKRSLMDYVVEPYRKQLIPLFDEVKKLTEESGSLGCSISGSGPSIFILSEGKKIAEVVKKVIDQLYAETDIPFTSFVSRINKEGIKILNQK
jgi:homoserine kinase